VGCFVFSHPLSSHGDVCALDNQKNFMYNFNEDKANGGGDQSGAA
jgi:hypothetical protein